MKYFSLFIWIFFTVSCVKDKPSDISYDYDFREGEKAYIIHEGNYMSGNASLSYYHFGEKILNHFIYKTSNNGEILGDVFQSMYIQNDLMYLLINHSNKIIVCDRKTLKKSFEIPVYSPRYIYPVSEYKFYITSLYSNQIHVYNTYLQRIEKTISLPYSSTERIVIDENGLAYVTCWDAECESVYIIDVSNDQLIDSIALGSKAPNGLLMDKNNNLWVWAGNEKLSIPYTITVVNKDSKSIQKHWTSEESIEWIKPCMNTEKNMVYWIALDYGSGSTNSGVYRMSIDEISFPSAPFIPSKKWQYFYALKWNPIENNLWVGDPKSFSERSEVMIYNVDGTIIDSFKTQVGIGDFYFYHE